MTKAQIVAVFVFKYFAQTLDTIISGALFLLAYQFLVAIVDDQVIIVCAPSGRHQRLICGSTCWHALTLVRLLLAGGNGGNGLIITPSAGPPATFFVCALVLTFVVAGAPVAAAAASAALAVAVAAVESTACVATAESTSAVVAVAETAVASFVAFAAAAGAWLPGLAKLELLHPGNHPPPLTFSPLHIGRSLAPSTCEGLAT
jgi:hypothetical protein